MNVNFGEYIKQLRLKRGYSVNELAAKSGVSNAHISRMERGLRSAPSPRIIKKLANTLKANYEEMLSVAGYLPTESGKGKVFTRNGQIYDLEEVLDENSTVKIAGKEVTEEQKARLRQVINIYMEPFITEKPPNSD